MNMTEMSVAELQGIVDGAPEGAAWAAFNTLENLYFYESYFKFWTGSDWRKVSHDYRSLAAEFNSVFNLRKIRAELERRYNTEPISSCSMTAAEVDAFAEAHSDRPFVEMPDFDNSDISLIQHLEQCHQEVSSWTEDKKEACSVLTGSVIDEGSKTDAVREAFERTLVHPVFFQSVDYSPENNHYLPKTGSGNQGVAIGNSINAGWTAWQKQQERIDAAIKRLEKYKRDRDIAFLQNSSNENLIASTVATAAFLICRKSLKGGQGE